MTKRHFTIFTEVCRQMSFSKAAEALNTTQPTVSLAVKELEEHYGVRLFERMNRRIYMTEAGRALLSTAQEVLRGFQQAEDQLRKAPYRLRVGANVTFGATRLPRVLAQFRRKCPQVELSALVGNSDGIERLLLENRLDVGLVDNVTFSQHLRVQPLFQEDMALLCAPAFPHRPQSLEELAALPLLLRERGSGTRRSVDRVFEEHSLSPQPFLESVSSTALIEAARAGLGVLILSPSLARRELETGALLPLAIPGARFFRQYFCALHKQKALSPPLEELLALLRKNCQE